MMEFQEFKVFWEKMKKWIVSVELESKIRKADSGEALTAAVLVSDALLGV